LSVAFVVCGFDVPEFVYGVFVFGLAVVVLEF
jgi:hypothetical protein